MITRPSPQNGVSRSLALQGGWTTARRAAADSGDGNPNGGMANWRHQMNEPRYWGTGGDLP